MNKLLHNKQKKISYKINTFHKRKINTKMKYLILKTIDKVNKNKTQYKNK